MKVIPVLRTNRLVLRPLSMSDLQDYHALQRDAGVSKFGGQPPQSLQESEEQLTRSMVRQAAGESSCWSIAESPDQPMIGFVGLVRIDELHRRSEVTYRLRSDRWGRGFATEALGCVVGLAFDTIGFHRLEGQTDPDNLRSVRVLERCGFVREGVLRENYLLDGVFYDSVVYGRLAGGS